MLWDLLPFLRPWAWENRRHLLLVWAFVRSAEPTTGCALRILAAILRGRGKKFTYMNWAWPTCKNLSKNQKQERSCGSLDKELVKVTWKSTWELEETKEIWDNFSTTYTGVWDTKGLTWSHSAPNEHFSEKLRAARLCTEKRLQRRFAQKRLQKRDLTPGNTNLRWPWHWT